MQVKNGKTNVFIYNLILKVPSFAVKICLTKLINVTILER